jgi:four helix bundle protein
MSFTEQQFNDRTKAVGLRIIQLVESLPSSPAAKVVGDQLLRSGTSIGANYRAACRAVSVADIILKLGDVEEETDESMYWIEMISEAGILPAQRLTALHQELNEILAMIVASRKTLRRNNQKSKIKNQKSKMRSPCASSVTPTPKAPPSSPPKTPKAPPWKSTAIFMANSPSAAGEPT